MSAVDAAYSDRVRVQCRQIQFQMQIPRVGTKNVLCLSVQVRIVAAGTLSQTVCRNDFLIPIGADFRNLNLPALYAYPYSVRPTPPHVHSTGVCTAVLCKSLTESGKFCFFVRDVPEEGHVEAETCKRHIVQWQMSVCC